MIIFYNPRSNSNGYYGVANASGPSLMPIGGLYHTVFQLYLEVFESIDCVSGGLMVNFYLWWERERA